jgi:hypothetical protein
MAVIEIKLGFNKGFDSYDKRNVKVDELIFAYYLKQFIHSYVKKGEGYRIGKMSKNVIFEGRTYGEIGHFAMNLMGAKELEQSVLTLNPELAVDGFSRFT